MTGRAWGWFGVVSVLWGIPYLLIAVALDDGLSPGAVAFLRVALAAALLVPLAVLTGRLAHLRGRWPSVGLAALLGVALPFLLISIAERTVDSGLTGVLIATEPMFIAALTPALLRGAAGERLTPGRVAGLALGLAGVAALVGVDAGGAGVLGGAALVLVASLSYAGAVITIARGLDGVPPLSVAAGALGVAAVLLAPAGLPGLGVPSGTGLAAVGVLGVACTAAAFLAFFHLIALAGPGRASLITYAAPVVAVALGVALRDEPFTMLSAVGVIAVLAGSWLATRRARAPGARSPRPRRGPRGPARGPVPGRSAPG